MSGSAWRTFVFVLSLYFVPAVGFSDDATSNTGNELSGFCNDKNHQEENVAWFYCVGVIRGVAAGYDAGVLGTLYTVNNKISVEKMNEAEHLVQGYCFPSGVTFEQMALVVTKYLKDHPETLNQRDAVEIINAFRLAWPCNKG